MSYTEIYAFDKAGDAYFFDEIQNAYRGAMAVWRYLEEKYLPSLPAYSMFAEPRYYSRVVSGTDEQMKEFWALAHSDEVSDSDKLILATTYDRVVLLRKDFQLVIDAYNAFEGESSLKEQAALIEKVMADEEIIAMAWNQHDDNNHWSVYESVSKDIDEEEEDDDEDEPEPRPYNLFKDKKHRVIFDDNSLNE